MGLFVVFVVFVFSRRFFTKPTNPSRKPKMPKTTKEDKKHIRNNQKKQFLKVSDSPLDMGLVFLVSGFPGGFYKTKQNLRENQKY